MRPTGGRTLRRWALAFPPWLERVDYSILDGYLRLHVDGTDVAVQQLPASAAETDCEVAENILAGFGPGEYPYLAEMAVDRAMKPGYNYGVEFEYGLDLILDGLARARISI